MGSRFSENLLHMKWTTTHLINQLFENPAIHLKEKTVKSATLKLQKIQDLIQSVATDLDHDESDS